MRALTVLRDADRALAGWTCESTTECCRFGVTGREPYLTRAEWELMQTAIARSGRRLPAIPADGTCPLLSEDGRCTVYDARPLGCRTFYCDRATGPAPYPRRAVAALPRALEDLSGGERGRPLRSWLRTAGARHQK